MKRKVIYIASILLVSILFLVSCASNNSQSTSTEKNDAPTYASTPANINTSTSVVPSSSSTKQSTPTTSSNVTPSTSSTTNVVPTTTSTSQVEPTTTSSQVVPTTTSTSQIVPTTSSTTETQPSITTSTTKEDVYFDVVFKNYDDTVLDTQRVKEGETPSYSKSNPKRSSDDNYKYTFSGWNPELGAITGNTTYTAQYTRIPKEYYIVQFKDYDNAILSTQTIKEGTIPVYNLSTPVRANDDNYKYTFSGWNPELGAITGNTTYTAQYTREELPYNMRKYTITIVNIADDVDITGIISGDKILYDTPVTLKATNKSGLFLKWSINESVVNTGNNYSFKVPDHDVTITITANPYIKNGNKIYFGTYPQKIISDNTLITELNTLAGILPTSTALGAWCEYNYYYENSEASYMYYQDIDYDNNGVYDYRGVYFTQCRPYYSSGAYQNVQDVNGYITNNVYWFSYEPIEWNIITESNGKVLIMSNLILDSQDYNPISSSSSYSHNGGSGYSNNYELSNIRKWLNDDFYNIAFNSLQKKLIETTIVDNSVKSTGDGSNMYVCKNTTDKIFLLSYQEATTYFLGTIESKDRQAKGTDYAKVQGLTVTTAGIYVGNSPWWLRSPYYNDCGRAKYIIDDGSCKNNTSIRSTNIGVRPVLWINL